MSLYVSINIKIIKSEKPIKFRVFEILGLIGERFILSIPTNNNLPPSSAGNGSKFITARLSDIRAVSDIR